MAPPILSRRDLNRATLARQMLLDRRQIAPLKAIEILAGLQAQVPRAPFIFGRASPASNVRSCLI